MKKRIISLILTAAMLLTLVPVFATSAAAADTYTITYVDGSSTVATQTVEGTGLVYHPAVAGTSNSSWNLYWKDSTGTIYPFGSMITPTANVTLTLVKGGNWSGHSHILIATAVFADTPVEFGENYIAAKYTAGGFTYEVDGTTQTAFSAGRGNNHYTRMGNSISVALPDYGEIARPGDGTNGLGVPAGYEFSHYMVWTTGNNKSNLNNAITAMNNGEAVIAYEGDLIYTVGTGNGGSQIKIAHGETQTTYDLAWQPNYGVWVIPVFKKVEVSYSTTYNANFGETPATTNVASLDVPENTFVNEGHEFLFWCTEADGTGARYYPGDTLSANNMTLYAIWGVEGQVNVLYIDGENFEFVSGTELTAKNLERAGYTFKGWKLLDTETSTTYTPDTAITEDCVLEAVWTINNYVISFDANGGTTTLQNGYSLKYCAEGYYASDKAYGANVQGTQVSYFMDASKWTREGYIFAGLNNEPDGTGAITWDIYTSGAIGKVFITSETVKNFPMTDFTMYAQWIKADSVTITYEANGGTGSMLTSDATVVANGFTRKGYAFTGWNTQADGKGIAYAAGDAVIENTILYAQWSVITYKITFDTNNGTYSNTLPTYYQYKITGDVGAAGTFKSADLFNVENWTREGYTFAGFNNQADGKGAITWGLDMAGASMSSFVTKDNVESFIDNNVTVMYAIWISDNPVDTEITLKEDATLILGEEYVTGLYVGMTVTEFLAQFEDEGLAVLNANGEAVTEGAVGTGYKVVLMNGEEVADSYTLVLFGDVDGDCDVNVNDIGVIRTHVAGTKLTGAYLVAGNADRAADGDVNVNDIGTIRQHVAGIKINQGVVAE